MKIPSFRDIQGEYFALFTTLEIQRRADAIYMAKRIAANEARYQAVADKLPGVPWAFIGIIHALESDCNFRTHLHNGDPLTARTVNIPSGRPLSGKPPFTWEESAWDAMIAKAINTWSDWTVAGLCYQWERYNGWGYWNRKVPSPYLWAGCQHYTRGKYVADGVFDPDAVSKQIGAAVLLQQLGEMGLIVLRATLNPAARPKEALG